MTQDERIRHRIKIIQGHILKLQKMVAEDRYCIELMTQSLAIQKSLKSLNQELLKKHLATCVKDQFVSGEDSKAINELSHLYHLSQN
ncbi:MAG: metal-sensitive transcriptional regulator [Candidatus Berkelbacteria bacterium]|nr:MAG: metal-sensitive transcriptional regulator [Candidatus Berkelbacteria bacterium]QQG51966.1 MAG: metal-sensitive transcriptional regulator [Candidatus Berkelbacteria bacterium]